MTIQDYEEIRKVARSRNFISTAATEIAKL